MRKILTVFITLAAIVGATLFAYPQLTSPAANAGSMLMLGAGKPTPSGADPFALDGTPQTTNSGGATSIVIAGVSTTFSNDVVYCVTVGNGGSITGVSGGGLTWTRRKAITQGSSTVEIWSAVAATPLSSVTITPTQTSLDFFTGLVFAFSGAHSASPFDANGSIPFGSTTGAAYSTSNANDIIIGATIGNVAIDSPFTALSATATSNFLSAGYRLVSATQTSQSINWGGTAVVPMVGDAIIQGP